MDYLLQQTINGLTIGSVYSLIAIGYTMVYGIIRMVNFAHGEVFMIGAYSALLAIMACFSLGLTSVALVILVALIVSVVVCAFCGWTIEKLAYKPLRNSFRLAPLISAIGASIFLQNAIQLSQGARIKALEPLITGGIILTKSDGFAVRLSYIQCAMLVLTLLLMGALSYFVSSTTLGRAQRACEQDITMAEFVGVNVDRTISATFVIGAILAAIAGTMVLLYYGVVDFYIGFVVGVKAFTAAVLGGIGSLPGAVIGGLLIGLIEAFWSGYFSVEYKDVAVFVVLILVLTLKPSGLLGRPDIEKV
ncbi:MULTISPECIES: branched-chain amino acid ABC transporter permease LivH [unclassified Mesorhizobium]|uniref:ABC transporter permease subunit n=1 Tax=unclassified Mesorhizobium TaxID=325217 RepID=UPI0010918F8E|nr:MULTISPECIES: branched-chain amino acid ABC transporter permease LivH [unclassified Mesorhizobium]TGS43762.1 branched-chain amino acid ABC transporter permease LivH [Mesorhizobium sp. M8A.F.Ca.ET.182.01.1.1]TGS78343.1 branched-chain amino acid ABC transporter permease LivH [Mesorhizobium sp. M8A.F.Ca.ET.181.01.1.1]TGV15481.1 branched-chain amino acid ABC transporter permease LivH [Mesorhizobium sp. M8A.F.Ca.ET.173.01.1.1]